MGVGIPDPTVHLKADGSDVITSYHVSDKNFALQVIFLPRDLHWTMVRRTVMVMVKVLALMWILLHLIKPLIIMPN